MVSPTQYHLALVKRFGIAGVHQPRSDQSKGTKNLSL